MTLASKYLNPQYDISFKRIFGTEKNKELLLNFLNVVLKNQINFPIIEVVFLKTVQDPEIASKKQSIVDVLCKDTTGVQYIIEMQMTKGSGFEERAQYYAAKAYVNQMLAGDRQYANLKEVIFIAIANYNIFPHKKNYKSEHVILDRATLENDLNMFSFTFINLPKFAKIKKKLKDLTLEEKWYYFLKNAQKTNDSELDELVGKDIIIKQAYRELDRFGWSEEELATYDREIKRQLDEEAIEEQIRIDAKAEGKAEGKIEEKMEVVKKMSAEGLDINIIAKVTDLTVEEIKVLLKQ